MENTDKKETVEKFEEKVRKDLISFLQQKEALDAHVPECPDVEEKWPVIARAYLPDGAREFNEYPVVSLGWMMLIGMAMAYYWDTDWAAHSSEENPYAKLRDMRGFDEMDDAIIRDLLHYEGEAAEKISDLVAECASRTFSLINHEHVEPGTEAALGCYIAALHQLYLAGMAMELNALGYHMTPLQNS